MFSPFDHNEHGIWCPVCGDLIEAAFNMDDDDKPSVDLTGAGEQYVLSGFERQTNDANPQASLF